MALDELLAQYRDIFGPSGLSADGIAAPDAAEPALIVCFTNRSGSNYLCELLRSTGQLGWAPEALNAGFIEKQIELWDAVGEIDTLAKYVRRLRVDLTGRGQRPPVVKLGWQQLFTLAEAGILDDVFPNRRLLLARRRDLLAQSVSYAIAAESGEWRSDKRPEADAIGREQALVRKADVTVEDIIGRVRSVLLADRHFRSFAAASADPLFELTYEDVDADPQAAVDDVLAFMDLALASIDADAVRVHRQASERNASLAADVVRSVRKYWDGPVAAPHRERWDSFLASYPMTDISDRIDNLWGGDAWDTAASDTERRDGADELSLTASDELSLGADDGVLLVVSPLIEDAHHVGRWLLSHPTIAGPSSPVFPAEVGDATPGGIAAHLRQGIATDGKRWRLKVIRPYEFCYLVESRLLPKVLPMPRVVFLRHGDLLGAGEELSEATGLGSAFAGVRSIAEAEQQVREVAACFGIPLEEIRMGGSVRQAYLRRDAIAGWLDIDDDLLFAPTPMMAYQPQRRPVSAREAAIAVWPRIVDHETGDIQGYGSVDEGTIGSAE